MARTSADRVSFTGVAMPCCAPTTGTMPLIASISERRPARWSSRMDYRPLEIYTVLVLEYLVLILVVSAAVRWFEMRMGAADKR